ncbi:MAG: nicotinamide mononucleotide transporter [Paludibacteraceae bacterium]|nr:nicotinamide mononucleotide transporter [Paludibacteraceae bacterium]MBR4704405.1 nicotinamide mononucleotide transporter [Paludibacteraceae bacterium]
MKNSRKIFDFTFILVGLLVQVVTFYISNSLPCREGVGVGWISLLSGCLGIFSVCLASQGNILTFVFGFGQVITYTWLCWTQRFYGEMAINAYYFVTMIYGVYVWRKRLRQPSQEAKDSLTVVPRQLTGRVITILIVAILLGSWLVGWGLAAWTDDKQPYLDAFTTVPALVAQVLMILVYREHWFIWLAVDVLSVVLWFRAGDYCMTAQYVFWCANCLYGLKRWDSLTSRSA